jgi:polysaccharide pyruvyl transferase WcaK-like protein
MQKATVHGCYNTTNFGDLLLLELTAKYLYDKWKIQSESLRLPADIRLEYCSAAPSVLTSLRPNYAIFGGGGYLEDEGGSKIGTKRLLRYWLPAKIWRMLGVQYAVIAPGGGPTAVGLGAERIRYICANASHISLRDAQTVSFVKGIGVDRQDIVTTADLALTIKPSDIPDSYKFDFAGFVGNKADGKKVIGIHLEKIYQDTEQFLKFCSLPFLSDSEFLQRFHLIFFYDYKSENTAWVKQQIDNIKGLSYSVLERMNHWTTADFLRQCDAILTTKLHVSIVSAAFGVPVFGFSFHQKTERFYQEIGRAQFQKMWDGGIECINDWMLDLKNEDSDAWKLSKSHMDKIKKAAELNFSVLDKYMESRGK